MSFSLIAKPANIPGTGSFSVVSLSVVGIVNIRRRGWLASPSEHEWSVKLKNQGWNDEPLGHGRAVDLVTRRVSEVPGCVAR